MSKFIETEYKYYADNTPIDRFTTIVHTCFKVERELVVSGYDDYFANTAGDYLRHRYNGDKAELTVKRRLSQKSTAQRVEVDVGVEAGQAAEVAKLAEVLGYTADVTIYKTCLIWWTSDVNVVFYLVYTKGMEPLARVIEIEANKDCDRPLEAIEYAEYVLGKHLPEVRPELRRNESMFERFSLKRAKHGS